MTFGALRPDEVLGSHTDDEWQALVRKYGWRCFYCGSPVSAWQDGEGRVFQIRSRNAERQWESSGKVMTFVEALRVEPEHILTKDHLVPRFHNGVRVEFIWNIRPADLRCNRLKGNKTLLQFRNERPGMIEGWLNSLPSDDWRVREWDGYPTDAQIEAQLPQTVEDRAQQSTGVFALASGSALGLGVEVEKVKKGAVFASTPLPSRPPLEEQTEPGLLKKLIRERDGDVSWAWRNPA
jgi:hypothetical protein